MSQQPPSPEKKIPTALSSHPIARPDTAPTTHFRELTSDAAELAASEGGREFLTYLVACALAEDQGTFVMVDGVRYDFRGSFGIAPQWLDRPLTEIEQRWLTAAILARTNFFGVEVIISMRHPGTQGVEALPWLEISEQERTEFTLCEGDFFGNIFIDPPVKCVAVAPRTPAEQAAPVLKWRLGTQIDPDADLIDGKPLSLCDFVIVGNIGDPDAHRYLGIQYDQYVRVYLKPDTQPKADTS